MKRLLLALAIPASLILSGCSSSPTEGDPMPSATSTFNVLDGLVLESETTPPNATTAIVEPSAELEEGTSASVANLPGESQMCRDLMEMMEQFPGTSTEERREALTNLRAESAASEDWRSKTASEQASMNRAFDAAMSGEC
ncbi:hypothetical protein TSUKUMMB_00540 [Rhodococcus sp. no. 34]